MKRSYRDVLRISLLVVLLLSSMGAPAVGEIQFGNYFLNGDVEFGGRFFADKPSRIHRGYFELYRDYPEMPVLERLDLLLRNKDMSQIFEVLADYRGENDQNVLFRAAQPGLFKFEFEYDKLQHMYSTVSNFRDEILVQWESYRVGVTITLRPELDLFADYKYTKKFGERTVDVPGVGGIPNGYQPGIEPIGETDHNLTAGAEWADKCYQFRVAYGMSMFDNDYETLTLPRITNADNFLTLAPSNIAHYVSSAGGVNLPYRTRINAAFSYGWLFQDDNFFFPTIGGVAASQKGPSLDANTIQGQFMAQSRPIDPLTLKFSYRAYHYEDTGNLTLLANAAGGDPDEQQDLLHSRHYPYTRQTLDFGGDYRFQLPFALNFGYRNEQVDRDFSNGDTSENTVKFGLKTLPFDWLNVIATYQHAARDGANGFVEFNDAQQVVLAKFYQGDRARDRFDIVAEFLPMDTLTFSANVGITSDSYKNSTFGLLDDDVWSFGFDGTWSPIKQVSLTAGYMYEHYKTRELSSSSTLNAGATQSIDVDNGPTLKTIDTFHTFTVGADVILIPEKLTLSTKGSYSFANTNYHNVRLPDLDTSLAHVESFLKYRFTKSLAAKLGYVFEEFDISDAYSTIYTTAPVEFDMEGYYTNYTAHMFLALIQYTF